ncbi:MAG: hypothetical protein KAI64_02010 [Thermoplasmata archaeon]|nr:hypothetical protein [Thermoplasmata archaeon]
MRSRNRTKLKRATEQVRPKLKDGAGRWLLLYCEHGHFQSCIPFGNWSDARKRYGRKHAMIDCAGCAGGNGNGRT